MDSEMFTVDGGISTPAWMRMKEISVEDAEKRLPGATYQAVTQAAKLMHTLKLLARVALIVMIIFTIVTVLGAPALIGKAWKDLVHKSKFTQKENLQWLGASSNVIRGDYENNTDSLAEKAAKRDREVTDISAAAAKATFLSRERMATTPEDELMRKIEENKP